MKFLSAVVMSALLLVACAQQHDNAVPRQEAYPRVEARTPQYQAVDGLPLVFLANRAEVDTVVVQELDQEQGVWLTLPYPRFGATAYVTLTPVTPESIDAAVANRVERMDLNFGSSPVDADQYDNAAGYHCTLVRALSPVTTPVQLLAMPPQGQGYLVSGAVMLRRDSLVAERDAAIIDIIYQDLNAALHDLADN